MQLEFLLPPHVASHVPASLPHDDHADDYYYDCDDDDYDDDYYDDDYYDYDDDDYYDDDYYDDDYYDCEDDDYDHMMMMIMRFI